MPAVKTSIGGRTLVLDARPDQIDLRDRSYLPKLECLPAQFPDQKRFESLRPEYAELILDQGKEGACTGFGLAALINYLLFRQRVIHNACVPFKQVSPAMLYRLAQMYDEWPGEDYEGSSCRGAMKGWHKHGACSSKSWPYHAFQRKRPAAAWRTEAAQIPLGAYYRVDKDSVADMQSALFETGAVYVSSTIFPYWAVSHRSRVKTADHLPIIMPTRQKGQGGVHSFALIGYRSEGFIVQNSWGREWGSEGFAIMPYDEWAQHGLDAWVAAIGAPTMVREEDRFAVKSPASFSWSNLSSIPLIPAGTAPNALKPSDPLPTESAAYRRTLVLENNGRLALRLLELPTAAETVQEVGFQMPFQWFKDTPGSQDIVIIVHGGLNDEMASLKRIRRMAPWFEANGIRPLFISWKSGFMDSLVHQLQDIATKLLPPFGPAGGPREWLENGKEKLRSAFDRTLETLCHSLGVRGIWSEMKENATLASSPGGGAQMLAKALAKLKAEKRNLRVHLIGHSAGAVFLGAFLSELAKVGLTAASCHLYAPACTVPFALQTYGEAFAKGTLKPGDLHIDILDDERELADSVGELHGKPVYGKSLLYLISMALEESRKTPILGMERSWLSTAGDDDEDLVNQKFRPAVKEWQKLTGTSGKIGSKLGSLTLHGKSRATISDGTGPVRLAHGSFDNDILVINKTIARILKQKTPPVKVTNLSGF